MFAGGTIELTCAILDKAELQRGKILMYLCRDGDVAKIGIVTRSGNVVFTFPQVTSNFSGNYTCVYTTVKGTSQAVSTVGHNSIFIQVKGNVQRCFIIYTQNLLYLTQFYYRTRLFERLNISYLLVFQILVRAEYQ